MQLKVEVSDKKNGETEFRNIQIGSFYWDPGRIHPLCYRSFGSNDVNPRDLNFRDNSPIKNVDIPEPGEIVRKVKSVTMVVELEE